VPAEEPQASAPADLAAAASAAPARALREQLPGLEPDRQIDDWGRSERVERALDRTVYDFLYHYWFRAQVEGVEHVPGRGGALLVANHAGALALDAAMIAKAICQEQRQARQVWLLSDAGVQALPWLGMLATKLGVVSAHPANLQRLLFDEQALVLVFPEGGRATARPLSRRYRLAPFDPSFVTAAQSAGVPIVPIAVLGLEEAMPALAGALRLALPLPARVRLRFLEPVDAGRAPADSLAAELRGLIQDNLLELVGNRRSVWLG